MQFAVFYNKTEVIRHHRNIILDIFVISRLLKTLEYGKWSNDAVF